MAKPNNADCVLHGGDLYDESKPDRNSTHRVMETLRQTCMGPGMVKFQCVNDQQLWRYRQPNFADPSYNVGEKCYEQNLI